MKRSKLLSNPGYWVAKLQIGLFRCANAFMKKESINRTGLAERMGVSKGYVSQVLNGDYDHRLSKFVEMSLLFGYVPEVTFTPIEEIVERDLFCGTGKEKELGFDRMEGGSNNEDIAA